MTPGS